MTRYLRHLMLFMGLLAGLWPSRLHAYEVPDTVMYCGMKLVPDAEAKALLAQEIERILKSPLHFNQMVQRARIFMPIIEEALSDMNVPTDLKYLPIQESSLKPDAVSSSQAVGFWQFKIGTAQESGLIVDDLVDERRHIYRSSRGAAAYLSRSYLQHKNWVYAIIGFKEGLNGAIPYTDPAYHLVTVMPITKSLHWYAIRAIAHKMAYEPALSMGELPEVLLSPFPTSGITTVKRLYEQHNVAADKFFEYNSWLVEGKQIPKEPAFTYYIPQYNVDFVRYVKDPTKNERTSPGPLLPSGGVVQTNPNPAPPNPAPNPGFPPTPPIPVPAVPEDTINTKPWETAPVKEKTKKKRTPAPVPNAITFPVAKDPSILPGAAYVDFQVDHDLHHGLEFYYFSGEKPFHEIAMKFGLSLTDLREWNQLAPGELPAVGSVIYLKRPDKASFHIVKPGESLDLISSYHQVPVSKIRRNNRLPKGNDQIYVGQKLYLLGRKPKEPMIVLVMPNAKAGSAQSGITPGNPSTDNDDNPVPPAPPEQRTHTVQPGETLWGISQRYKTRVEEIKRVNKLASDAISPGQILIIPPSQN
jgi:membrane-bound lytic murein transglycosylase D